MVNVENLKNYLSEELGKWDQSSIAVGIIKDGKVVLNEGFGWADKENGKKSDADTIYEIGSCSKAFTAATMAKLVDLGKVSWDTRAKEILPWLEFQDQFTTENVTIRDLLCHRTGLPRHDAYWIGTDVTREGMVRNLKNMQPCWSFRSHWCYQNTCIVAAGMIIEAITGKSWEEAVQEYILDPIGMNRTMFFVDQLTADANHAEPYGRIKITEPTGYKHIPYLKSVNENFEKKIGAPMGPAGSIASTINDMLKWVEFNLNNGKVGDVQVVSEENMKEVHKPQMLMSAPLLFPFPEQDFFSYALCWFTETYRGHKMIEHGGNINGFSALVTMIPDENLGIVTLTNFDNSFNTYASTYTIIDEFLGLSTSGDWGNRCREMINQVFASAPEQAKMLRGEQILGTTPSHDLACYAGTYENPTYGKLPVWIEDGKLYMHYGEGDSVLEHFHYDTFTIANEAHLFTGMNISFITDKSGKISGIDFAIVMDPAAKTEIFTKVD